MIEVEADGTVFEFPDGTSQEEMKAALDKHFGKTESVFGTPLPTDVERLHNDAPASMGGGGGAFESLDDTVRMFATGVPFADEFSAGMNALFGVGEGGSLSERYDNNLAHERRRNEGIREREPIAAATAQIAGGLATGGAVAKTGLSLMKGAKPTLGSMAGRGAAEGAVWGGLFGASEAEQGQRAEGALTGGALGGSMGALTGAFFWPFMRNKNPATLEGVKKEANEAIARAERAGLEVLADSYAKGVDEIALVAKNAGIDAGIHPKATSALKRLQSEVGENLTLDKMMILRRVLKAAAASNDADERRIAMVLTDAFDDFAERLMPQDAVSGDPAVAVAALKEFRGLWSRYRKGERMLEAVDRAAVRAGQFSGSGYENALRTEFRSIAMNRKIMRTFTEDERAAIRKVAMGGPIENVARLIGKFAPTGVISQVMAGGAGYAIGGPVGAVALPAAGLAGRQAATTLTKASAMAAVERMLTGKGPKTITPEQAKLLLAVIVGEQPTTTATGASPSDIPTQGLPRNP